MPRFGVSCSCGCLCLIFGVSPHGGQLLLQSNDLFVLASKQLQVALVVLADILHTGCYFLFAGVQVLEFGMVLLQLLLEAADELSLGGHRRLELVVLLQETVDGRQHVFATWRFAGHP